MVRERTKIPESVEAEAMFASDRSCCICESSKGVQLHHVDGNPSNHDPDNIAVLCLDHHDEATRTGGMSRKLSAAVIRKYREEHYRLVRTRRAPAEPAAPLGNDTSAGLTEALSALAIHEIRKLRFRIETEWGDWQSIPSLLMPLNNYATEYDNRVRLEVVRAADALGDKVRWRMPYVVAREMASVARMAMPVHALNHKGPPTSDSDIAVLKSTAQIGEALAYDGAKYLHDLQVVNEGAQVLWTLLRFATWNDLTGLAEEVRRAFGNAIRGARDGGFPDGARWLDYRMRDATAIREEDEPAEPPADLLDRAWGVGVGDDFK